MDKRCAEGRRARLRIRAYQVVPKRRVQRQGCWPDTELPGFVAVRWRRGNGAALVCAWEGADQRAADGVAPPPLIRGGGSPPRRQSDRSADGIAVKFHRLVL